MEQAVELLTLGMGTVFVFLGLLVLATSAMSRLLQRYAPQAAPVSVRPRRGQNRAAPGRASSRPKTVDPTLRRAVELALKQYAKRHL